MLLDATKAYACPRDCVWARLRRGPCARQRSAGWLRLHEQGLVAGCHHREAGLGTGLAARCALLCAYGLN